MSDLKLVFLDGKVMELERVYSYETEHALGDVNIVIRGSGLKYAKKDKPSSNQSLSDVLATYVNIYRTVYSTIKELVNDMDDEEIRFISNLIAQKGANSNEN